MKRSMLFANGKQGRRSPAFSATTGAMAGLVLATVGLSSTASAEPSHWETIHEEFGPDIHEDFCDVAGLTVEQSTVLDGRVRITSPGRNGLPYYSEDIEWTDTWTNLATGESVTTMVSTRGGDLKVTDNGDGTLTILVQGTGTQLTYDESGQLIARDAGVIRYQYQVDHGGTPTDPTDDEFLAFLGLVKDAGRSDDFCAAIIQAIG